MAKLLNDKNASIVYWDYYNDDYNPSYKKELKNVAKIIYNAGYRKILQDSVVLSREEYEILTKDIEHPTDEVLKKLVVGKNILTERAIEKASKETAEKFESELKAFIKVWKMAEDDAMSIPFYRALFEKIGELAKQFGVEIKE